MRPEHAGRFERILGEVCNAISFTLIGNIVISVIAGTVVGVAAVIVGAPSPMVLALIVGLLDLIPQIGSTIAAVIVTLVTLIASGPAEAAVMLVVILVYQQAENYLIQPAVMRQAVELSGFATIAVGDGRRRAARRGRSGPRRAGRRLGEDRPARADRGAPRAHGRAQRSARPAVILARDTVARGEACLPPSTRPLHCRRARRAGWSPP